MINEFNEFIAPIWFSFYGAWHLSREASLNNVEEVGFLMVTHLSFHGQIYTLGLSPTEKTSCGTSVLSLLVTEKI